MNKLYLVLLLCGISFTGRAQCPAAAAIVGGSSPFCVNATTTLTDATPGGSWTSANTAIATVGLSSGVVTGAGAGTTTITYTTSCGSIATTIVTVNALPTTFAVTGGGAYCASGLGVHVGVNNSATGTSYQLQLSGSPVGSPLSGSTGSSLDFGLQTSGGTYTVQGTITATGCSVAMSGNAVVSVNPLPTAFTVGGGGSYCSGGTGVNVTLSSSTIGVNYQLMQGATPIGSALVGTSSSLSFGPVTAAATYTVSATNGTTGCTNAMAGSASVSINALPTAFSMTGGGGYCLGGTGVHVGTSGSTPGVNYQLLISGSPVGSPLSGSGSALDFGLITVGGTYTVLATNTTTGCQQLQSGTSVVTVNPLPTVFTVTGGGAYCFGGSGVGVGLNGSTIGVNYQLYNGSSPVGSPVAGTGVAISFGNQTTVGSYSVVAINGTTGCTNNMFGSVSVTTTPLPTVFTVTGGGGYCAGGSGVHIGLAGSTAGTVYSLINGATTVGAVSGTGSAVDFGLYTLPGTYTVSAQNTLTGCVGNMSGSVTVTINPLPTVFTLSGGGTYCAGGAGMPMSLNNSTTGVNYQLYNGASPVGSPQPGNTGSAIPFGNQTAAGSYTVIATNATTTCTNNMSGSAVITINPLPTAYAVTGGGGYCTGGSGVHVGLAASNTGVNYQLYNGATAGVTLAGTGFALDYGALTAAGTYTVTATNTTTSCSTGMSGNAVVVINSLPTVYPVTGGGSYCSGGAGVPIGVSTSTPGVNYQLTSGGTPVGAPIPGSISGGAISFGNITAAGVYSVTATNGTTACSAPMSGSATITVNPLPTTFAVTGGGAYCSGAGGLHIGLSGSQPATTYQLYNGPATSGLPVTGTGGTIDFGAVTAAGTYTVTATTTATGCTNGMTGSTTITINPLPGLNTITGGGSYCAGGAGVNVGLNGSIIGISYQLMNGASPVGSPVVGTSLPLSFGLQTASGTYTVVGSNMVTGCSATMTGTTTVNINGLPAPHNVTGGGSYCVGGTGVAIGLNGSNAGTTYQLYNGATAIGPSQTGTGLALNFGNQTALGIYTIVATNTSTGCSGNMTGSATVATYPLPIIYNVTGGGSYCSGGAGVNVGLSGSNAGISYQLFDGGSPITSLSGSGLALNFGPQTTSGTYTIVATNTTTGCTATMNGTAAVNITALPTVYTVTEPGGSSYCAGGTGVAIGLSGSDAGTTYQLLNGTPVGSPVVGTGSAISFGNQTVAGLSYTVMAINPGTTCTNMMSGSVPVIINPLPTQYPVLGGGHYCNGGTGADINISPVTDAGVTYQLYNGVTPVGTAMPGGGSVDFGNQTAAGTYTVMGTITATGCTNDMSNTVAVVIDPLPTKYIVTGGGAYCAGTGGLHVSISGSNAGISYQLMVGGSPTGSAMPGTGMAIDFGAQTVGGNYTVQATNNTTGCQNMMNGSVNIVVNPLPIVYSVSSTSSTYCAGGGGVHIWLDSSQTGISYQLMNGSTTSGSPVMGSGGPAADFGFRFTPGSYRVIAMNTTTGCVDTMSSGVTIVVNPLPTVYAVTGGGAYCAGSGGVHVGLSGSNTGISYQLMMGGVTVGTAMTGTGGALDFGLQTAAGNYTVVATNPATTCVNNMSGSATVAINSLPIVYTLSGGGTFCAGGTGVHVGLSNSTPGVDYQLYAAGVISGFPVHGSGMSLDFGLQTAPGTYTVIATNTITGCTNNMGGLVTVGINAAPTAYTVVGGGGYCPGGSGVNVGLANSNAGINYQLMIGGVPTGSVLPGSGSAINFGLQTVAGTYTVMATNTSTGCTNIMAGSAAVVINSLPTVYVVGGGGSYCAGGAGVHVGVGNSDAGINYKLINGLSTVTMLPGTGSPLDFGLQTMAGTYTVQAVNATTGCSSNMAGSAVVTVTPLVTPFVTVSSNHGDTICEGTMTTFTAHPTNGGSTPTYQWMVNSIPSGSGASYAYTPSNGDVVSVMMSSSAACATPMTANGSVTMAVDPNEMPMVSVSANPGTVVCQGTNVHFTAYPTYGGTAPTYQWYLNGNPVMTGNTYGYTPVNGDIIFAVMTSNYHCALTNTATSTHTTMEVDQAVLPVVTVTAHPGNSIAPGQTVTLTASVVNGGPSPTFQWLVNGIPVTGATTPTFVSNTFNDGDSATCQVVSSGGCSGLLGFNSIYIHVHGVGVQPVVTAGSDVKLVPNPNSGRFTVKGTLGVTTDEEVTMEVTDMLGKTVYSGKTIAHNGSLNEQVDLAGKAANGMYLMTLRSAAGNMVFHLVVEQ